MATHRREGVERAGEIRLKDATGRWMVLTTVLGSSMAMLDSTVVNVALPRIGRDLDTDLAALQWTVNAYMITLAGLILLGGALGDRFGRRRVFLIGVI
ncbi:MFS transporter, partial [Streptomyces sp. 4F]